MTYEMQYLAAILDEAKPGERIFAVAYGSGAGSDAFDIVVTDEMAGFARDRAPTVKQLIENPMYLDYAHYAKFRGKINMGGR